MSTKTPLTILRSYSAALIGLIVVMGMLVLSEKVYVDDPLVRLAYEVLPIILVLTFFINSLIYLLSPEDED